MSPDAFYRLFQSVLEVHGFVALDSGDAIEIVPDANARFGEGDDYVTQAIVLDEHRRCAARADPAAVAAAIGAPRRASDVERADRRGPAAEHRSA